MGYAILYFLAFSIVSMTSWMPVVWASGSDGQTGAVSVPGGAFSRGDAEDAEIHEQTEGISLPAGDEVAPGVNKLPPIAIGAMQPAGKHLTRPREEVVERWLRRQGKIVPGMTPEQARSALKAYYDEFSKKSSAWVSPAVQERALQRGSEAFRNHPAGTSRGAGVASAAVQPVTAQILVLAVEFGGNDTFTYSARTGSGCVSETITTSGPLQGQIPHPGARDNNTVWFDPAQTANAKFYEKLIFGHEGVGRVRLDLKDPTDHKAGINLCGYTVQDYYDHAAGAGNVVLSGSVEGWLTVDHSEGFYGAPSCSRNRDDGGGPAPVWQLVVDALGKFREAHPDYYSDTSPGAFWKQFDANGDRILDSLWIIHAGMGQEEDGGQQGDFAIWSHSSDVRGLGYKVYEGDPNTTADDIIVGPYTMQPENTDLGVVVEEFGHNFFGLPDLYTSDMENSIGFWSIMSGGTWAGWLGGATPVGMPLWFRMIAQCGAEYCNWNEPMLSVPFDSPSRTVTIGQLENTPAGFYKGVKIDLPDADKTGLTNPAGSGKAAYTGSDLDNANLTLDRKLSIARKATGILSFQSFWEIEEDRDYGYVMIKSGQEWTILDDLDGVLRETNPYETNLGHGLTGSGNRKLRFDLSAYRGKTVTLRLRYQTDASKTEAGWWVDGLKLDGKSIDPFENTVPPSTFPGWVNTSPGWLVAPAAQSYPNYYLVEWRSNTTYDKMLKTAYISNYIDEDEWQVERVPYNIPGAVLYYCNTRLNNAYALGTNLLTAPSIGPKNRLLVVDMNFEPMRLGDTGTVLDARRSSYDAALTLQPTKPFTIGQVYQGSGAIIYGPWEFPAKPAVRQFDDAKGYYAGLFAEAPCKDGSFCFADKGGSAVIPAFGNYTTRITHADGSPFPELYGTVYQGSILGSGNPGDDGVQCGVRVRLLSKSSDNKTAKIRINAPVALK